MVSDDHGKSWNEQVLHERDGNVLFQDRDLYAIQFTPDGKSGWIAGEMGIVLHSDDSGKTWTRQQTGIASNLFNVSAVDAQHAYACGAEGLLLSTVDGGQHWNVYKYKEPIIFFDVHYTDPNSGWMVGEFETILHTTDGGKTWNVSHGGNTSDFTIGPSFSIVFTDLQHALVTGLNGEVLITEDSGKTWKALKLPEPSRLTRRPWREGGFGWAVKAGGWSEWMRPANGRFIGLPSTTSLPWRSWATWATRSALTD